MRAASGDPAIVNRPHVLLSVAVSLDGYIDDATPERLLLSNPEDLDRVDAVRAGVDAILVGAGTLRADNPRLLVRSPERRAERVAAGRPEHPAKVTLTRGGGLDPFSAFFTAGDGEKLVYAASPVVAAVAGLLGDAATVVDAGDPPRPEVVLADLAARGVRRVMVEGGTTMCALFLEADLVDEIQLAVAPLLVGDPRAPRFVHPGRFPQGPTRRLRLEAVMPVGDVALLVYRVPEARA